MNVRWVRFVVPLFALAAAIPGAATPDSTVTEGVVNAPVDQVWKALTTQEGIESWMVAKTQIDLQVGALWRTSYSKESNLNDDQAIHHMILAFDPGRMLSFRTVKAPKGFPFPNALAKTWTVIYLDASGAGQTRVTLHMLGFTSDEESQKMRGFFEAGNKTTLDSLIKKFEVGAVTKGDAVTKVTQ